MPGGKSQEIPEQAVAIVSRDYVGWLHPEDHPCPLTARMPNLLRDRSCSARGVIFAGVP